MPKGIKGYQEGHITSVKTRNKIGKANKIALKKYYLLHPEAKEKIRERMTGKIPWNKGKKEKVFTPWSEKERVGHMKVIKRGEASFAWKGDGVGYFALHDWVERVKGKPQKCEFCKIEEGKFEWANRSHLYKRDINDWIRLCIPCHRKFDAIFRRIDNILYE